jgi:hypothetical protein
MGQAGLKGRPIATPWRAGLKLWHKPMQRLFGNGPRKRLRLRQYWQAANAGNSLGSEKSINMTDICT